MSTSTTPIEPPHATAQPAEPLAWAAYCARSFPGRRERHDFAALASYAAYRRDEAELAQA